jgi:hypothetical protein
MKVASLSEACGAVAAGVTYGIGSLVGHVAS